MKSFEKHPFAPVFDKNSEILILGSFPSKTSRQNFYYHHPQNRFWKILSRLFGEPFLADIPARRDFLLAHHIALWDVIASCEIEGSSDGSIQNALPNDLGLILENSCVKKIFANGKKAGELYQRHCYPKLGRDIVVLPSSSPANARCSLEALLEAWRVICL
ncbi:DNA-deoxyinosine glycosylase [Helicobacter sp. 11S02596-1]|uniref:DNA-deoxyinosine glycosylase n=1 Tax=Helicobacter sp. 11S02596-1 TaxID=1476194 RepID=UPI000BA699FF|nr:DNA-deoxyinosine glycosylase [Helicobacter sp. 11S02596-1]PAF42375.1 DNA-deoxyinosine glycosylase [Helicobacter sp. 11S02596-1]